MRLVDRDDLERLIRSADPDAALVLRRGRCVLVPGGRAAEPGEVVIARHRELAAQAPEPTGERLDRLACCLDNAVRDLGG